MKAKISLLTVVVSSSLVSFGARAAEVPEATKKEVVASYAAIAGHVHADAQKAAVEMEKAIAAFIAAPSEEAQVRAKNAWIAARLPYAQSEVFRVGDEGAAELDGPVDKDGFKAIEFILWGADENIEGAGTRSHEDFIKAKATDAAKLQASAKKIVTSTAASAAAWKEGGTDNRRVKLLSAPADESLAKILANVSKLAGEELAKKRIGKAYETTEQKDESAEFSDITHLDLTYACSGIANLIAGAYVGSDKEVKVQGAGLLKLAEAADPNLAEGLKLSINRVMLAMTDFRPPFDRALMAPDDSPAREAIKEMMDSLEQFSKQSGALGEKLGLKSE